MLLPSSSMVEAIKRNATERLFSRLYFDSKAMCYKAKFCSVCDCIITINNPCDPINMKDFKTILKRCKASKLNLLPFFSSSMVNDYTTDSSELKEFCLSPRTRVFRGPDNELFVDVCRNCAECWTERDDSSSTRGLPSPKMALWNGTLTGETPDCLKDLNTAELALVSPNRILTNAIVLFCDHHEGIYGWHSMFENDVQTNVSNVQYLIDAGLQGSFYCVLCGPWTNVHIEKVRTTYSVRPEKVITAFRWLKDNNIHFKDFVIPSPAMLPSPRVIQHSKTL